jgi:hypothetical protein
MKAANTLIAEAGRTPGMTSDQRAQQLEVRTSTGCLRAPGGVL